MKELTEHIYRYIIQQQMCIKGDLLLVAVSGGVDSIALLDICVSLRHRLGIRLAIAHYDHRLRKESGDDVKLVRAMAAQYELPIIVGTRRDIVKKISEDQARQLRMSFLTATATKLKAAAIVTGHHQDDLAETVLMRIVRGSGLSGLKGITPVSHWGKLKVVRPLLTRKRQELQSYVYQRRLKFHEDVTNNSPDFLRNRVRHELLPLLQTTYNPQVVQALVSLSELSVSDYDYLLDQARQIFDQKVDLTPTSIKIAINNFLQWHPAMERMVLRLGLEHLYGNVQVFEAKHIQAIIDMVVTQKDQQLNLPRRLKVVQRKGFLILSI